MLTNQSKIDKTHIQIDNTCLLSSFAVVGNYFNGNKIDEYFEGYYNHFINDFLTKNITFQMRSFENVQSIHINCHGQLLNMSGYDILDDLYKNSNQQVFVDCRNKFNAENVSFDYNTGLITNGTFQNTSINDFLQDTNRNTIINIFLGDKLNATKNIFDKIQMHSLTVYYAKGGFYCHDTNNPKNDYKLPSNWWNSINIRHVLIYWKK